MKIGDKDKNNIESVKMQVSEGHFKYQSDQRNSGQSKFIGPQTSTVKWVDDDYGISHYTSPVIDADGIIYIQSVDLKGNTSPNPFSLFALKGDGSFIWSYPHGMQPSSSPAIGRDGTIYFGSTDGKLHAVRKDGSLDWIYKTDGSIKTSPTIGYDKTIYIACMDKNLYALDPDGSLKWKYLIGEPLFMQSPAIGEDGAIYITCDEHYLYAINPDGIEKWSYKFYEGKNTAPIIGPDGDIYLGSKGLYAINPEDGSEKWKYPTPTQPSKTPAVAADGTIYIAGKQKDTNHYILKAISPHGKLLWEYTDPTEHTEFGLPTIGKDGTIYIGCYNGPLHAIKPDGTVKWIYKKEGMLTSSPAISPDGTLYFINSNQPGLYAIKDSEVNVERSMVPSKEKAGLV